MTWAVTDITKAFDVTDPESGDKATVTIRRMSEGDSMLMQQLAAADLAADKPMSDVLVALRKFRVARFVTAWTIPLEISEEAVLGLDPRVVEQIDEQVQLFNPGVFPTAQSHEDKSKHGEALAGVLESYLAEEDDTLTREDLQAALDAYRGDDVPRPTDAA